MSMETKALEILKRLDLDALLISNKHNVRYITGYRGDTGCVLFAKNRRVVFTDFRYIYQAQEQAVGYEVIDIGNDGYAKTINQVLEQENIRVLGFEQDEVLYAEYFTFTQEFKQCSLEPIKDQLSQLRAVKTAEEIEKLAQAEHIGDQAFDEILQYIKPGVTEIEIAARLEFIMKMNGAEGISFPPIVASGVNSSMPHAVPSLKKLETGDFLTMDFGCIYEGYCSDMTRTVILGKASEKQKEIYSLVLRAQETTLQQMHAGMKGCEIDGIARTIIYDAGYEGCFGHGLGHGVGLAIHEAPRASIRSEQIVEENMIVTVEPGVYIKEFGGVRIEDMVVVTKDGHRNLAYSPKQLIEI